MLFTDEGIFTADVARQVHASAQFQGFGDGLTEDSPWGFFDVWGVLEFLKGPKYSLLYFWDSPTAFWIHMIAFQLCAVLFMIGFRTRLMGVLTFFLMNSIFFRNHLFWEGTELVYRVFLAYLICAKSGYAYSVDNWLRCQEAAQAGVAVRARRAGQWRGCGAQSDDHPEGAAGDLSADPCVAAAARRSCSCARPMRAPGSSRTVAYGPRATRSTTRGTWTTSTGSTPQVISVVHRHERPAVRRVVRALGRGVLLHHVLRRPRPLHRGGEGPPAEHAQASRRQAVLGDAHRHRGVAHLGHLGGALPPHRAQGGVRRGASWR